MATNPPMEEQGRKLAQAFAAKGQQLDTLLKIAMEEACILVEGTAVLLQKPDTGQLRKSISHRVSEETGKVVGQVGTNLEYAAYVEFGTGIYAEGGDGRKTPWRYKDEKGWHFTKGGHPRPFLRPALSRNKANIKTIIARRLKQAL